MCAISFVKDLFDFVVREWRSRETSVAAKFFNEFRKLLNTSRKILGGDTLKYFLGNFFKIHVTQR